MPFLIVAVFFISVSFGTKAIQFSEIIDAIFRFDESNANHQIILSGRIPRAIAVLLVGAFLAAAGAIMQGITRNFLASPSIMGVTDGSAFSLQWLSYFYPGFQALN